MEVGNRVRYIHNDNEDKETGYYPPDGTLGTVLGVGFSQIFVEWDSGTKDDGRWYCEIKSVETV